MGGVSRRLSFPLGWLGVVCLIGKGMQIVSLIVWFYDLLICLYSSPYCPNHLNILNVYDIALRLLLWANGELAKTECYRQQCHI